MAKDKTWATFDIKLNYALIFQVLIRILPLISKLTTPDHIRLLNSCTKDEQDNDLTFTGSVN